MQAQISEFLEKLEINHSCLQHKAVFTVAESSKIMANKTPVKSLLLQEVRGEQLVLVIMSGGKRLEARKISDALGTKRLQFASPEILLKVMGVRPGAVSLFGLLHPEAKQVKVVVDRTLTSLPEVGFHPNDNTSTIFIPGEAIERIIQATNHKYAVLDI